MGEVKTLGNFLAMYKPIECDFECGLHGYVHGYYIERGGEKEYCCPECEKEEREKEKEEEIKREAEYI